MTFSTDILVIGAGIAGLSFAAKTAKWFPDLKITLLTKDTFIESNTRYAQGGIAIALDSTSDSFQRHIEDTMIAGAGLCNREVVEKVVCEGPNRLRELIEWGVQFDRDATGHLALGREGGHTAHRIIHYKDATGYQIAESLLKHLSALPNVVLLDHHLALDVMVEDHQYGSVCTGVRALDVRKGIISTFSSRVTLLATGGAGQVYATTTNPLIATGDGMAMAARAGATMKDMEFVQFHPTAFYSENDNPSFLISEAVRGFGAYLRTSGGERFVFNYDERGELASRDIVSKAIHHEILARGENSVFLDCTHLPAQELREHFPTIYDQCLQKGIDITKDVIPVAPAAHYMCGGVEVDMSGRTSIKRLYACGECSYTGLHGANRLASNSLLEALVYAHEIFLDIERTVRDIAIPVAREAMQQGARHTDNAWIAERRRALRLRMSKDAGIVRTTSGLSSLWSFIRETESRTDELYATGLVTVALYELRNMVAVSKLIVEHSVERSVNMGTFFNSDLVKA
jgi:L-aspartate oxidase